MGWLWSSSSDKKVSEDIDLNAPSSNEDAAFSKVTESYPKSTDSNPSTPLDITSPPSYSDTHELSPPPRERTRDEIANSEFLSYLNSIQAAREKAAARKANDDDDDEDDYDDEDLLDDDLETGPRPLLTPRHLYPSTVSCNALFSQATKCQSPGGQILELYRYGTFRSCAQHWNNFWWCMRTNRSYALSEEEREERIRRRYWEQDQRTRARAWGCSEDVWRQRKERLVDGWLYTGRGLCGPDGSKGFESGESGGGGLIELVRALRKHQEEGEL